MDIMEKNVHHSVVNVKVKLVTKKMELVLEDVWDVILLHFAKVRNFDYLLYLTAIMQGSSVTGILNCNEMVKVIGKQCVMCSSSSLLFLINQ